MSTAKHNSYPPWTPRFWNGMLIGPYLRLLAANRFRIHPLRIPMAVLGSGVSCFNSSLAMIQRVAMNKRIHATQLTAPPIFIIGHWRSGTTLMHELLTLDHQFAFPNNFDAFSPNHLLISRPVLEPLINLLLPGKRPMDAMAMDARSPQEDDFALISLGAPTLYRKIAFPNQRFLQPAGDSQNSDPKSTTIHDAMVYFLQVLTARYHRRLVLKSPPHTSRLRELAEWFPGAKFIHLARHPYQVVPSTIKLWRALDWTQGFEIPRYTDAQLQKYIFDEQAHMYEAYESQVKQIPAEDLIEIRFEDLIANPVAITQMVYDKFALENFDQLRPAIENYFSEAHAVKPTLGTQDVEVQQQIAQHWQSYFKRFGYET